MIKNAKDSSIEISSVGLPNMGSVLDGWLMSLIFSKIETRVVNFKTIEEKIDQKFKGVWQPLSATRINMKPERERQFMWYQCHSKTDLSLNTNDVIQYKGKTYRVMAVSLYDDYGYFNYELVEDFSGVGPYDL